MAVLTPRTMVRNGSVGWLASTSTGTATSSTEWRGYLGQTHLQSHTTAATVTPSTVSSGFCDVLIPRDEKIGFLISWHASSTGQTAWVGVAAGSEGRAWQRDLGQFTVSLTCTRTNGAGYQRLLGPFESARFAYQSTSNASAIKIWIAATATGNDASQMTVDAFRMPSVSYDT